MVKDCAGNLGSTAYFNLFINRAYTRRLPRGAFQIKEIFLSLIQLKAQVKGSENGQIDI